MPITSNEDLDETLPGDPNTERYLLGAVLRDNGVYDRLFGILKSDQFLIPAHGRIFATCGTLIDCRLIASASTVADAFFRQGMPIEAGEADFLDTLSQEVPSGFDPVACARRICDLSILRQLVHLARRIAVRNYAGIEISAKEEISKVWTEIADLRRMAEPEGRADDMRSVLEEAMGQLHHRLKLAEVLRGVAGDAASGEILGLLRRGTLTILAGHHGPDITGVLLRLAAQTAGSYREDMDDTAQLTVAAGAAVRLFSLTNGAGELAIRLMAARCGMAISAPLGGTLHQEDIDRLTAAGKDMRHWPLFIDDAPSPSLMEIDARCRRQQRLWGLGIVMIDSLDLVPSPRIADVAHGLRRMASELGIAVVASLHLPAPYRPNLDPTLADLSGFGSLVRHADAVAFVNKPKGPQHDGDGDLQVTVVLDRNGIRGA